MPCELPLHPLTRGLLRLTPLGRYSCTDESILGTPFYMMEYLEGRIFTDVRMPEVASKQDRIAWYVVDLSSVHFSYSSKAESWHYQLEVDCQGPRCLARAQAERDWPRRLWVDQTLLPPTDQVSWTV